MWSGGRCSPLSSRNSRASRSACPTSSSARAKSLAVIVGLRRVAPGVPGPLVAVARAVGQVRDLVGCITEEADLTASFATIAAAVDAVGGTAPHQVGAALRRRPS